MGFMHYHRVLFLILTVAFQSSSLWAQEDPPKGPGEHIDALIRKSAEAPVHIEKEPDDEPALDGKTLKPVFIGRLFVNPAPGNKDKVSVKVEKMEIRPDRILIHKLYLMLPPKLLDQFWSIPRKLLLFKVFRNILL